MRPSTVRRAARLGASCGALLLLAAADAAAQKTHTVRMLGDQRGYRFEPAELAVSPGDRVRFVMVSGGPHNVQFDSVPAAGKARLAANMKDAISELTGPLLLNANEEYVIPFTGVAAGRYHYVCTPHVAMNMAGTIVVRGGGARGGAPPRVKKG
jgi:plastocyanin